MKKHLLYITFLFFSLTVCVQAQVQGTVAEIIDGRTVVIVQADGTRLKAQMLYIEVPEPEQSLGSTVKQHLAKLVQNRAVKFYVDSKYSQGVLGMLFLNDVNIAQQMLRDGAAWYNLPEYSYASVRGEYQEMEQMARAERRGVWGIAGLKPAWVFREEKYQKQLDESRIEREKKQKSMPVKETIWADVGTSGGSGSTGIQSRYDRFKDETYMWTNEVAVSHDGVPGLRMRLKVRAGIYFDGQDAKQATKRRYVLAFHIAGRMTLQATLPELRLIAGNQRILITRSELGFNYNEQNDPQRESGDDIDKIHTYELTEDQVEKIVSAGQVEFRYGFYDGVLPVYLFNQLP